MSARPISDDEGQPLAQAVEEGVARRVEVARRQAREGHVVQLQELAQQVEEGGEDDGVALRVCLKGN